MSELIMAESATPSTPSSGKGKIFLPTQTVPTIGILDDAGVLGKLAFNGALTLTVEATGSALSAGSLTSWTPALTFGGGSTGLTYSVQVGRYKLVSPGLAFVVGLLSLSAKGSSTGAAAVALPVTTLNVASLHQTLGLRITDLTGVSGNLQCLVTANGSSLAFEYLGTGTQTSLTHAHFTNASAIVINGFLFV